jgi:hypothetical protein
VRLLLLVSILFACKSDKEPAAPAPKPQLPDLPIVAPKATPPSTAAPIGWWRSETVCLELHENGDFELAVMPPSRPKIMIVGTATATRDGEQWKLALTPTKIWQARFIGNCRKVVMSAKELDKQDVLGATLKPGEAASATFRMGEDVKLCFADKCETLRAETPTLRGRWRAAGWPKMEGWPKGVIVGLDIAGPSYTWGLHVGTGAEGYDTVNGDQDDSITLVGPDHYELTIGTRRFTASRLPGQHLELCEEAGTCTTLERGFDTDRTDVPCRE